MGYFEEKETPDDLLRDDSLSREEKMTMLEQWRNDKRDHLHARDEGMQGEDRSPALACKRSAEQRAAYCA